MYTKTSLTAMLAVASAHYIPTAIDLRSTNVGTTTLSNGAPAGPANIGKSSKTQTFKFLFDTGSDTVWVPGGKNANPHNGYNWSGKPLSRTQTTTYGGGFQVRGPFYTDDITIGGITASAFPFFINSEGSGGFGDYGADGIFGLCYCPSTDKTNSSSFFETLLLQKKIAAPEFGVFIGRGDEEGELTLGGYDAKRFLGPIVTVPVVSQGAWNIKVDGAYTKGKFIPNSGGVWRLLESGEAVFAKLLCCLPLGGGVYGDGGGEGGGG